MTAREVADRFIEKAQITDYYKFCDLCQMDSTDLTSVQLGGGLTREWYRDYRELARLLNKFRNHMDALTQ